MTVLTHAVRASMALASLLVCTGWVIGLAGFLDPSGSPPEQFQDILERLTRIRQSRNSLYSKALDITSYIIASLFSLNLFQALLRLLVESAIFPFLTATGFLAGVSLFLLLMAYLAITLVVGLPAVDYALGIRRSPTESGGIEA